MAHKRSLGLPVSAEYHQSRPLAGHTPLALFRLYLGQVAQRPQLLLRKGRALLPHPPHVGEDTALPSSSPGYPAYSYPHITPSWIRINQMIIVLAYQKSKQILPIHQGKSSWKAIKFSKNAGARFSPAQVPCRAGGRAQHKEHPLITPDPSPAPQTRHSAPSTLITFRGNEERDTGFPGERLSGEMRHVELLELLIMVPSRSKYGQTQHNSGPMSLGLKIL